MCVCAYVWGVGMCVQVHECTCLCVPACRRVHLCLHMCMVCLACMRVHVCLRVSVCRCVGTSAQPWLDPQQVGCVRVPLVLPHSSAPPEPGPVGSRDRAGPADLCLWCGPHGSGHSACFPVAAACPVPSCPGLCDTGALDCADTDSCARGQGGGCGPHTLEPAALGTVAGDTAGSGEGAHRLESHVGPLAWGPSGRFPAQPSSWQRWGGVASAAETAVCVPGRRQEKPARDPMGGGGPGPHCPGMAMTPACCCAPCRKPPQLLSELLSVSSTLRAGPRPGGEPHWGL